MNRELNRETANDIGSVETRVKVAFPTWTVELSVWCSRYIADKLRPEDWAQCIADTQTTMDGACLHLFRHGCLASDYADQLNRLTDVTIRQLVITAFRKRNVAEGNTVFQVDPKLSGEEYRV